MRASEGDGWKAVVVSGVRLMWRDVRSGLGLGGVGWMWWRYSVELGPEDRRSGYVGWKERDVIADCKDVRI